jgi:stage V sporulation protein R
LRLQHNVKDGIMLEEASRDATLRYVRRLWGYEVSLAAIDTSTGAAILERSTRQIGE